MSLTFVNLNGEQVSTVATKVKKQRADAPEEWHKGFKVVGIAPGAYEAAVKENEAGQASDKLYGSEIRKDIAPYERWKFGAKLTPVRAKPYEIKEAAEQCAELARKAGWDRVFVVEMKKEKQK